jgi:hypothetical protein
LPPFLAEPANQPLLGFVEAHCGRIAAAVQRLETLSRRNDPASVVFSWQLARELPDFKPEVWIARVRAISRRAEESVAAGAAWPTTMWGLVQSALGDKTGASATWKKVFLLPDRNLAHHQSRLALNEAFTPVEESPRRVP